MKQKIPIILSGTALFMSLISMIYNKNPKWGMVDINFIVSEKSKILAQKSQDKTFITLKVRKISKKIKENIHELCKKNNMIFISKNAILGGDIPDYTSYVYENLP